MMRHQKILASSNRACDRELLAHGWHKKTGRVARFFDFESDSAGYALAASSSVTAFIDKRMRPCLSTSSTLTLDTSPSFSLSETCSTRSLEICETCTRPSLPGRIVTNAPK